MQTVPMRISTAFLAFLVLESVLAPKDSFSSESDQPNAMVDSSPVIVFDQGHHNYGIDESDHVIEQFLSEHGYIVRKDTAPITRDGLQGVDIFHTSNALAAENVDHWALPTPSAFTPDEIGVLLRWVREGGSLLVAIEHMPFGGSYDALATALGLEVSNGFAVDETLLGDYSPDNISHAGDLLFPRREGLLTDHPVINGQTPFGPIEHLATNTGSAFRLPANGLSLITFDSNVVSLEPDVSWKFDDDTARVNVAGWSQAGIIELGNGRVAIVGDNYLISAPAYLEPPYVHEESNEAERGAHNHQFTLNLYRWLSDQELNSAIE